MKDCLVRLSPVSRLDVRQEAQKTLSTLLHFHFLTVDRSMLNNLFKLASLGKIAEAELREASPLPTEL